MSGSTKATWHRILTIEQKKDWKSIVKSRRVLEEYCEGVPKAIWSAC